MVDVRALLRAERAARAGPTTSSSSRRPNPEQTGKAENHPQTHTSGASSIAGRKRKVGEGNTNSTHLPSTTEEYPSAVFSNPNSHKRARSDVLESDRSGEMTATQSELADVMDDSHWAHHEKNIPAPTTNQLPGTLDEVEWAAFQTDMANLEAESKPSAGPVQPLFKTTDRAPGAVIVAGPTTVSNGGSQGPNRPSPPITVNRHAAAEKHLADTREDATRQLEIEMGEMNRLDEKVRKLKEIRDAIRLKGSTVTKDGKQLGPAKLQDIGPKQELEGSELDDSDEDYDDLTWGLGKQN